MGLRRRHVCAANHPIAWLEAFVVDQAHHGIRKVTDFDNLDHRFPDGLPAMKAPKRPVILQERVVQPLTMGQGKGSGFEVLIGIELYDTDLVALYQFRSLADKAREAGNRGGAKNRIEWAGTIRQERRLAKVGKLAAL
ncbi:hypothetical protein GR268_44635 [Rhizobium leguminosarum]|nr:hypothetical protein [Rhizobium leguminosarum]